MKVFQNILIYLSIILFILSLTSCCTKPWNKYPHLKNPDTTYRTGATHGYDVYIWKCLKGRRVVVYSYSAEMSCQEPKIEKVNCGDECPIEKRLKKERRLKVPKVMTWPR